VDVQKQKIDEFPKKGRFQSFLISVPMRMTSFSNCSLSTDALFLICAR
jgi:hypothetical protein